MLINQIKKMWLVHLNINHKNLKNMELKELRKLKEIGLEPKKKFIINNPSITKNPDSFINIDSIVLDEELTRINFIAYPDTITYDSGWWVQLEQSCFIRPVGSDIKLKLLKAVNIPFSPIKYYFKSRNDRLAYTLYFPALPNNTERIDIIEREVSDCTYFNFFGVSVEFIKRAAIKVN